MASAIRDALGLSGDVPYNSRSVEITAARATGTIKNNTFPPDHWIVDLNGDGRGWMSVEPGVDDAIMAALIVLRLAPTGQPPRERVALDDARFGRLSLEEAPDAGAWARDLEDALSARLRAAPDAEAEVLAITRDLRRLGHELWRWDESDDFAILAHDYSASSSGRWLMLTFRFAAYETPVAEVVVRDRQR